MLLLLAKPKGVSSFFALKTAQKKLSLEWGRKVKMGHSGTLDPLAEGLLLAAVDGSTKALSELLLEKKTYKATLFLGQYSSTDDDEGEKFSPENFSNKNISCTEFQDMIPHFVGKIVQIPPAFSALKKNGKRVCDRVRAGETVDMTEKKREVEIFSIRLLDFSFPFATIEVECGSGTYIRSLARDMGNFLGCGAYLSHLVRTKIGDFTLENAVFPEKITSEKIFPLQPKHFDLPVFLANDEEKQRLFWGQKIASSEKDAEKMVIFEKNSSVFLGFAKQENGFLSPIHLVPSSSPTFHKISKI